MKNKEKLGVKIKRALEFDEILGENDYLEVHGTRELTVKECSRIIHYSDREIVLALREYILKITGHSLYCVSYSGGRVRIEGKIEELKFDTRGV